METKFIKDCDCVNFKFLSVGDTFQYIDKRIWMKTETVKRHSFDCNAISLETGIAGQFTEDAVVHPVDAVVVARGAYYDE